jgi:hypothetical protein
MPKGGGSQPGFGRPRTPEERQILEAHFSGEPQAHVCVIGNEPFSQAQSAIYDGQS